MSPRPCITAFVVMLTLVLAACGGGNTSGGGNATSLVVASSDFPESKVLAEIYGQALEANGFTVERRHGLGSRETYIPALLDHSVDLVPDYAGNLLRYFDPQTTATTLDAIVEGLRSKLPPELSILTPSGAVDTDTLTVTAETAKKWNLKTIADLVPHEAEVKIAAPPEFWTRPHGVPGLKEKYGLDISQANFVPISDGSGPATIKALLDGTVTAADIFSTVPAIPQHNLVVLEDPNHLFVANNVVPLVSTQKKSDSLQKVLDAVSAKLTTAGLIGLNTAVAGRGGISPADAARNWLRDNGFDKPIQG